MKAERCNVLEQCNIGERGYSLSDFNDINGTDIRYNLHVFLSESDLFRPSDLVGFGRIRSVSLRISLKLK